MTTNRRPIVRAHRGAITAAQEMALWLGTPGFEDEDEARMAWERNRARLMDWFAHDGRRPAAWWEFDAPEGLVYDPDREQSTLYEAGLLADDEAAALVAYWREQFDRCHDWLGFCTGETGPKGGAIWLHGAAARKAHLAWADVPKSLVEKWSRERKAAAKG